MKNRKEYVAAIDTVIEKGPYKADWGSLSRYEAPVWFRDAKFGIFVHWGLYSIPEFNNEWYSRNMYVKGSEEYEHHRKTFGSHKEFGYKDFIPMFTAKQFDAKEWIADFRQAGAEYVVPVAEHHDGFQMYDSQISDYNAVKMGPKKDILGSLKAEAEKQGLVFATSSHRAEHYWFMGVGREFDSDISGEYQPGDFYWPSVAEQPDFQDNQANPYPSEEYLEDWLVRTCELIDKYQPRLLYFDWWIQHESFKEPLKKVAAYYYNRGAEKGFPVGICYKHDAMAFGSGIVDVERGKFAEIKPYPWQTDTAIARNSWCYTDSLDYKSGYEIITYLCDVVSKNGNLLLNVGPKADGSIAEKDKAILKEIGDWLAVNGEAIYGSRCYRFASEGPTQESEGQFSDGKATEYTSMDFRFTVAHGNIYAICMKYPEDGSITIKSFYKEKNTNIPVFHGIIKEVSILGSEEKISCLRDGAGLHFQTRSVKSKYPVVIKISIK